MNSLRKLPALAVIGITLTCAACAATPAPQTVVAEGSCVNLDVRELANVFVKDGYSIVETTVTNTGTPVRTSSELGDQVYTPVDVEKPQPLAGESLPDGPLYVAGGTASGLTYVAPPSAASPGNHVIIYVREVPDIGAVIDDAYLVNNSRVVLTGECQQAGTVPHTSQKATANLLERGQTRSAAATYDTIDADTMRAFLRQADAASQD